MPSPVLSRPLAATATLDLAKAQFSPGDTVHFRHRNTTIQGKITRLGPKNAGIAADDGKRYAVPYTLLAPVEPRQTDHAATEQAALERCRTLMQRHGLDSWTPVLDESTSRAGACNYTRKQICMSRLYVRKVNEAALDDTILHEIAHALVGPQHGHDAVWKAKARSIGCSAERCHTERFSPPRWLVSCTTGCFTDRPAQRRRPRARCRRCQGAITWRPWDGTTVAS